MKVEIDLNKSVEEKASLYFEKSKKAKAKLTGLQKAIVSLQQQLDSVESKSSEKKLVGLKKRNKDWFERYHWFFTSDGFLVIGGKDAKQNEEIVKKQMSSSDLYFHADVFGAPHCVLKTKDNSAPEQSLFEAAIFAAVFSRAWQSSSPIADVYSVKPEQVSKEAPSGEAIGKGAFMIYGERNWFKRTQLSIAIGVERLNESVRIISGPVTAVAKHSLAFVVLQQGNAKKSDAAKKIKSILEKKLSATIDLDEIVQALPNGEFKIASE